MASVESDAPVWVERDVVEGSVVSISSISPQRIPSGIKRIHADEQPLAHIGSRTTTDVDIAVIDTGIAAHPDLRIAGGVNCTGTGGTSYHDFYGHGTHVAGIIAARDNASASWAWCQGLACGPSRAWMTMVAARPRPSSAGWTG